MKIRNKHILVVLSLYISFVFIQSLFFKYSNSAETEYIFGTLDAWASTFGLGGIFSSRGIFSQYVIGTAELFASGLLLFGLVKNNNIIHTAGAFLSIGIISGAIFFHLFTPLGVVIQNDNGLLFGMACGIWVSSAVILYLQRNFIFDLIRKSKNK